MGCPVPDQTKRPPTFQVCPSDYVDQLLTALALAETEIQRLRAHLEALKSDLSYGVRDERGGQHCGAERISITPSGRKLLLHIIDQALEGVKKVENGEE